MLIASNGLVAIYKDINKNSCTNNCEKQQCFDPPTGPPVYNCTESCEKACEMVEESHDEPYVQKQAFGKVVVGVFVVMIGSLILRFLERIHDDPIVDSSTIPRQVKICISPFLLSTQVIFFKQ